MLTYKVFVFPCNKTLSERISNIKKCRKRMRSKRMPNNGEMKDHYLFEFSLIHFHFFADGRKSVFVFSLILKMRTKLEMGTDLQIQVQIQMVQITP